MRYPVGSVVQVVEGSGLDSGQVGEVVAWPRELLPMGSRREETAVRYPDGVVRSMHDDRLAPYPPGWTAEATARFYGYPVGDPRGVTRAVLRNFERALSGLPPAQPDDDLLTRATREAARSMVDDLRAQLADDDA